MGKTFYHHMKGERPITVKIYEGRIAFYYKNEGNREFYSIPIQEWVRDRTERQGREDNWHFHMKEKVWFNEDIKKYIDEIVKD